eukprot:365043-Chlamydomonas_euryale.AAC.18
MHSSPAMRQLHDGKTLLATRVVPLLPSHACAAVSELRQQGLPLATAADVSPLPAGWPDAAVGTAAARQHV